MRLPRRAPSARRRPLSTRISVFLAVVVLAALVVMVGASGFSLRTWMTVQTDRQLVDDLARAAGPAGEDRDPDDALDALDGVDAEDGEAADAPRPREHPSERVARGGFPGDFDGPGSGDGSLRLVVRDGEPVAGVIRDHTVVDMPAPGVRVLESLPLDSRPRTVDLGPFGRFRVIAATGHDGTRVVVGQSTQRIESTTITLMALESGLALVIIVGAALVGRRWVVREMAPLGAVAATARRIGAEDLSSQGVEPFGRVPADVARPGTEVGDVGQALNAMIANVEGALRARDESERTLRQFVADASHELRTPLASIQGYTQLLQRDSIEPETALDRIASESARMSDLVEDLLLLARLDAGRELAADPVDVVPLAIDAVSDAHAAGPDHQWVLDVEGDEDGAEPCVVRGDEAAIRQVLANLLTNARVHTPAGTRVDVSVRSEPRVEADGGPSSTGERGSGGAAAGGAVVIRVADRGPGIPEELRGTVFDRFVRGDASRTRAGTGSSGLGLSIVSSIAQALGGRVDLETSGAGTVFEVRLPRLVDGEAPGGRAGAEGERGGPGGE
ncbi:HAMP domain-containing histidine kinase [Actinomyces sp. B33]|uniref:sensor histidine kinase n=1 Tax=Actinomyces sp. B33 TaxID=2942131 RepID=UPI0023410462|nr:HAMP domain-containing sensor histidine kinase [Actinomyces sp. B33]MDC4233439.1 HAMP domain-containing histidine kinase [Actinomyces sp. B33]